MPYIKPTIRNPYGLSAKQKLVINDMVDDVSNGRGINPAQSTKKFYAAKSMKNAAEISRQNWNKLGFQDALHDRLKQANISGRLALSLNEGLEAVDSIGHVDYGIRLDYIKEVNRILGVYPHQ